MFIKMSIMNILWSRWSREKTEFVLIWVEGMGSFQKDHALFLSIVTIKSPVHFVLATYSWVLGLPWRVLILHWSLIDFPLASGYQLQIASLLRLGVRVHVPLLALGPHLTWICAGLLCTATVSVSPGQALLLCLEATCFGIFCLTGFVFFFFFGWLFSFSFLCFVLLKERNKENKYGWVRR